MMSVKTEKKTIKTKKDKTLRSCEMQKVIRFKRESDIFDYGVKCPRPTVNRTKRITKFLK